MVELVDELGSIN